METDRGKGKMTEIDNIVKMLGEGYEGLEDVHIDISMLEYDDGRQCDNVNNEIYEMLADIQFKSLISWTNNGTSFIIHDNHRFAVEVLPRFFRHNNLSSFICQLNCYGFKKVNWDKFEFRHEWFQRGKGQWLKKIKRKHSKSQMNERLMERQGIDETAAFTIGKEIEEITAEQAAMREEIIVLQRQLDMLERDGGY
ncbi:hypothetical protein CQW23_06884 [Capsicum baccatum]|uniref:HSF-type DNA-binding domain-containing protein n=1 Tax=Capsicum baccatum TaxID=33114 RepID=A0A2G2X4K9_CAPBA|nr:hypothetical protein CQW23_06884 [Capsicum baccatum]